MKNFLFVHYIIQNFLLFPHISLLLMYFMLYFIFVFYVNYMKFHHANWITMSKLSWYAMKRCFMISLVQQYIIVCYPGSLFHISITHTRLAYVTVTQLHAYHPLRWVRNSIRRRVNASKQDWYVLWYTVIKRFDVRARNEITTTANSVSFVGSKWNM